MGIRLSDGRRAPTHQPASVCITADANPTVDPLDHLAASLGVLEWEGEHLLLSSPLSRARIALPIESYAFAFRAKS